VSDDTAAYLEELAATLASHGSNLAALRREALEQKVSPYLPTSGPAPTFGAGPATPRVGSNPVANTLGNVEPYIEKMNRLNDPTFDGFYYPNVPVASETGTSPYGHWLTKLLSGSYQAYKPTFGQEYGRASADNPFNSAELYFNTGIIQASGTHETRLRSLGVGGGLQAVLPYLVASIKLNNVYADLGSETNVTSKTVTLEIYNASHSTVVATTTANLYETNPNAYPNRAFRLWTAYPLVAGDTWDTFQLRITFSVVTTGSGGALYINLGEPQLHYAYSPDPVAYAPVLGHWYPCQVYGQNNNFYIQSVGRVDEGSAAKFLIGSTGDQRWGTGAAVQDIALERSATSTLKVYDPYSTNGVLETQNLNATGTRRATPSASQTLAAGTALLANAEFVMFTCTGAVTSTAAPTIANGLDGQMLTVLNVGTGTWTISDQGTLASSNLRLTAATVAIAPRNSIQLVYSATVGDWVQVGALTTVI
jgi:hypothetical protein